MLKNETNENDRKYRINNFFYFNLGEERKSISEEEIV